MKNCNNKVKNTCGKSTYATCVKYETDLPDFSEIEGCPTIEETTEELYKKVEELLNETDLSELGNSCLTYVEEGGKNIVKNVLLEYEAQICILKQEIEDFKNKGICEMSVEDCNLPFGDLVTECGDQPKTLGETISLILNEINS